MEDFKKPLATYDSSNTQAEPTNDVIRTMQNRQQDLERQLAYYRQVLKSLVVNRVDDPGSPEKLFEDFKELAKQLASRDAENDRLKRELVGSRFEIDHLREENHRLMELSKKQEVAKANAPSKDRDFEFDR